MWEGLGSGQLRLLADNFRGLAESEADPALATILGEIATDLERDARKLEGVPD